MNEGTKINTAHNLTPPTPPPPPTPAPAAPVMQTHTGFEGDFEPYVDENAPAIRIEGKTVILENGAELPEDWCLKSGKPAVHVTQKALRDPRNPLTWFGGRYRIPVALSKENRENRLVALALTWSVLAIGVVLLASNLILFEPLTLGAGVILVLFSGVFRAAFPVWSSQVFEDYIEIRGAGEGFRNRLVEEGIATECATPEEAAAVS